MLMEQDSCADLMVVEEEDMETPPAHKSAVEAEQFPTCLLRTRNSNFKEMIIEIVDGNFLVLRRDDKGVKHNLRYELNEV